MTRNFHRWEVDPFFQAAEEVQDSADRLESVYRVWLHAKSVDACANDSIALDNHRRELSTALGTAKWQLEDFERAVSYLDVDEQQGAAADDAPTRHKQFVGALRNQINLIEMSVLNSRDSRDLKALPVLRLGQEEKDDLALFLCGFNASQQEDPGKNGYCASSTYSNRKGDEEAFGTSSDSVKSKNEVSDCFSTSASTSDIALNKADFSRSDHYCRPPELGWVDRNLKDHMDLEVYFDQSRKAFCKPIFDQLHVEERKLSVDSESGQNQISRGYGSLRSSVASNGRMKNQKEPNNNSKSWLSFTKKLAALDLRMSKSGVKRWKDGDANPNDRFLLLNSIHSCTDLEKGQRSSYVEDNLKGFNNRVIGGDISGSSMYFNQRSGFLNILQHLMLFLSTSRPLHRASAALMAVGFVGLILFHVT